MTLTDHSLNRGFCPRRENKQNPKDNEFNLTIRNKGLNIYVSKEKIKIEICWGRRTVVIFIS